MDICYAEIVSLTRHGIFCLLIWSLPMLAVINLWITTALELLTFGQAKWYIGHNIWDALYALWASFTLSSTGLLGCFLVIVELLGVVLYTLRMFIGKNALTTA